MKIINSIKRANGDGDMISVVSIVTLFVFSLLIAIWQILSNKGSDLVSNVPVFLPLLQAILLLLVIVFGTILYNLRYRSILNKDVMGVSDQNVNVAVANTESFLDAAAGGIIRLNPAFAVEYINDAAATILGFKGDFKEEGLSIYDLIKDYEDNKGHFILKRVLEQQFKSKSIPSVFYKLTLVNLKGEQRYVKIKTVPVKNNRGNVRYIIVILQDLTEERRMISQLYRQASVDSLTGLMNRHSFQRALDELLSNATHTTERHVLCYMDLDHFKVVNDVCGHAAGDEPGGHG